MNRQIMEELVEIVGRDYLLTDGQQVSAYLYDQVEIPLRPKASRHSIVVKPASTEEVSAIVSLASRENIPVVVRGGGTGLCGAATPVYDSMIISMERMNHILEIDEKNMMAVMEAGVTLADLLEELEGHEGIGFPVHPGDEGAQMGGMVSTNAGGARAVRHGIMRNHIKGIKVVLADGSVLSLGGKLLKDNAGYNLMHLIIGSEGTLAIVTEVTLRIYPEEKYTASIVASFDTIEEASSAVLDVVKSGVSPLAVEYQDKKLNLETAELLGLHWPVKEGSADLIIILSEKTETALYDNCRAIDQICDRHHAREAMFAGTKQEEADVLAIRSGSYDVIKDDIYHSFDMAVPPSSMPEFLGELWRLVDSYDTRTNITAHIADGNVHNDILLVDGKVPDYHRELQEKMYQLCFSYHGTITGEHGIGKLRVGDLPLQKSPREMELMEQIKKVFDPKCILNPGTVLRSQREE